MIIKRKNFSENKKKDKVRSKRGIGTALFWSAPSVGIGLPGALIGRKAGMKRAIKEDNFYDAEEKGARRGALVGGLSGAAIPVATTAAVIAGSALKKNGKKIKLDREKLKEDLLFPGTFIAGTTGVLGGISGAIGGGRGARKAIRDDQRRRVIKENKTNYDN